MKWTALAFTLPAKSHSTLRVSLWRRLRRLGAVAPVAGMYLLPAQPECVEAFQWLVQEICQAEGEAFACIVDQFHGMSEQQLVDLFNSAREKEYEEISAQLNLVEAELGALSAQEALSRKDIIIKLRRHYAEIVRIDFFHAPSRTLVAAQLDRLEQLVSPEKQSVNTISLRTRPRPHVDRLACAWLIRRFIDSDASIRYFTTPEPDEISFDMQEGEFSHQGPWCTFETMRHAFQLDGLALQKLAQIVHEIDLRDGYHVHPETVGIDVLLRGWLLAEMSDHELEEHGIALFEGLYLSFQLSQRTDAGSTEDVDR
jgi:hypothetical protein